MFTLDVYSDGYDTLHFPSCTSSFNIHYVTNYYTLSIPPYIMLKYFFLVIKRHLDKKFNKNTF